MATTRTGRKAIADSHGAARRADSATTRSGTETIGGLEAGAQDAVAHCPVEEGGVEGRGAAAAIEAGGEARKDAVAAVEDIIEAKEEAARAAVRKVVARRPLFRAKLGALKPKAATFSIANHASLPLVLP